MKAINYYVVIEKIKEAPKKVGGLELTEDQNKAEYFFKNVDSSSVMHNLPTCWADGFEYGLGAEVGISTDKIHARGPVGLEGLTSQKFIVKGNSNLRGV